MARGGGDGHGVPAHPRTVLVMAPSCWSPSRYQTMVAAGLALRARQVRLYGVPARSRISGAPSMVGSSGGTAEGRGDTGWVLAAWCQGSCPQPQAQADPAPNHVMLKN